MRPRCDRSYVRGMTNIASTELQASPPSSAWLRIMALVYDPFVWLGEMAGMRRRRSMLLSGARGRVVEIGAGTGLNIAHYPDGIDELVLMEPEPAMRRRLARRLQRHARAARIIDAPAEHLPLTDESVDTVVSTLVLCTARTRAPRDRPRAPPRWAVAVRRTRARELAVPGGVAGLSFPTVAQLRRRLPLQPSDRGVDARLRIRHRS
jgi:SAM-dependent methyltransferase